jgi:RNA-directed DNA polymerase
LVVESTDASHGGKASQQSAGKRNKKEMNQMNMEAILEMENMRAAYRVVRANDGAPGIDGMRVKEFGLSFARRWEVMRDKLKEGTYEPAPVLGVEIPKPNGGQRLLGIPSVQDRVIQQAMHQVMSPHFERKFSVHSYGFRPGRSAHDAVRAAREFIAEGKRWVVDIDLKAFFDQVDHDILMREVRKEVAERNVLKLIGKYLKAAMVTGGERRRRDKGTPQGGPLSPLLANIYLDPLDKELERRGLSFVRYADDIAIYVSSPRAGERVLASITQWLARELKLEVNQEKSRSGSCDGSSLLGFKIDRSGTISVAPKAITRLKDKVRELWDARQSKTSNELRDQWRRYIDGWWNYYRLSEEKWTPINVGKWIRRHIRKAFWQRWHCPAGRKRALKRLGVRGRLLRLAHSSVGAWRMAAHAVMNTALSVRKLQQYRLDVPWDFAAST